jgi:hypothetical protein
MTYAIFKCDGCGASRVYGNGVPDPSEGDAEHAFLNCHVEQVVQPHSFHKSDCPLWLANAIIEDPKWSAEQREDARAAVHQVMHENSE